MRNYRDESKFGQSYNCMNKISCEERKRNYETEPERLS